MNDRYLNLTDRDRFLAKVAEVDGCWLWTGSINDGYGTFWDGERMVKSHRFAYELLVGPIPDGLQLDHLCRNRACVNPDHLEPVTQRENILRGDGLAARQAKQTHCVHGHEFTPENTLRQSMGRSGRRCRECKRIQNQEYKRRKREGQVA